MKVKRCNSRTGNASWAVGYLLRKDETGLIFMTDIMQDPAFRDEISELMQQQKDALYSGKMRMTWDLLDKRKALIANAESADFYGRPEVATLEKLVHDMDTTMQFTKAGKHFRLMIEPIKLPDAPDPNAAKNIINAVKAVRDMFPQNLPALFTLHTGGEKRGKPLSIEEALEIHWNSDPTQRSNIHIQGLIGSKPFANEKWGSPYKPLSPKDDEQDLFYKLSDKVEDTVAEIMGTKFNKHFTRVTDEEGVTHRVALDPHRPIVERRTEAGARIVAMHPGDTFLRIPLEALDPDLRKEISQRQAQLQYDREMKDPVRKEEFQKNKAFQRSMNLQLEATLEIYDVFRTEDWSSPNWYQSAASLENRAERIQDKSATKAQKTEQRLQKTNEYLKSKNTDFMDFTDYTEHQDKKRELAEAEVQELLRRRDAITTSEELKTEAESMKRRERRQDLQKKFLGR